MKATFLICCVLAVALSGLSCAPEPGQSISLTEGSLSISVTEVDSGVMIENLSGVACIAFVNSPEGEQRFELAVGENVTVTDISQPIEVSAVTLRDK